MKTYRIYLITNNAKTSDNLYVGQTCKTIEKRFHEHLMAGLNAKTDEKNVYALHKAIYEYGKDAFTIKLLEDNISEDEIDEKEIYYIKLYDSFNHGYNETLGGQGIHGYKHTEEIKQTISQSSKNRWQKWKLNEEWLNNRNKKISMSQKGKKKSEEQCKKMSEAARKRIGNKNSFYGKHHSEKTKQLLGKKKQIEINMYSIDNVLIHEFDSAKQAAKWLYDNKISKSLSQSLIIRCCKHKCKFAYGFVWKYKKEVKCND